MSEYGFDDDDEVEDDRAEVYADDPDYFEGRGEFADPGGRSALRAASSSNPRNLPCPSCGASDRLTPADRARGYQCDSCADREESGGW